MDPSKAPAPQVEVRVDSSPQPPPAATQPAAPQPAAPVPSVLKGPELVTIIEDKPLTIEQLELHGKEDSYETSYDGASVHTPLLRSTDRERTEGERTEGERSTDFQSFTTSQDQASLFIPSVQFSLYSSRETGKSILSGASNRASLKGKSSRRYQSVTGERSSGRRGPSFSASVFAKLADNGQAPALLALWNVINMVNASGGVLGMPYAVALGGFPTLVLLVIVAVMTNFTGIVLIDCLYKVCPKTKLRKKVRASYADIGAACFGATGGRLVDIMTVAMCYSCMVLYIMMLGSSMMGLAKPLHVNLTLTQWCAICTVLIIPIIFIRQLAVLAWLSMIAVCALVICVLIIIGYCLGAWRNFNIGNIPAYNLDQLPIALGIIVFGYCGHAVFPGIEGSMSQPKQFNKVSYAAFTIVTTFKFALGFFCCLLFGTSTESIITLNLTDDPNNTVLSIVAIVLVMINVYFCYPLNMFVSTETLDIIALPKLPSSFSRGGRFHIPWLAVTRIVLAFTTFGIAIAIPKFGFLMGIFGSVLGACLSFIFPCLFHLKLKWKELKWHTKLADVVVIVFGAVAGALGLIYSSIALKNS